MIDAPTAAPTAAAPPAAAPPQLSALLPPPHLRSLARRWLHEDCPGPDPAALLLVAAARSAAGFSRRVEAECGTAAEALQAALGGADIVLLDNMAPQVPPWGRPVAGTAMGRPYK
uniref:Uncharacterized protein n=1 Tax=Pavo cristatus TaxID=9049 RepID=A0A8C9FSJ0_PAVCR